MEKYYTTSEKIGWMEVIEVHRKEVLKDDFVLENEYIWV